MAFRHRHRGSASSASGDATPPPPPPLPSSGALAPAPHADGRRPEADSDPAAREHDEVVVRHGDLEIEEDMHAQRRLWRWQKVSRVAAVALLAFALAGGLGDGPLARREIERDGVALAYERIGWRDAPQAYELTVPASAAADGRLRVWLDRETAHRMRPTEIVPPPARASVEADRLVYEFEARPGDGRARIALRLEPPAAGRHAARLGIVGGPTFEVDHVVLP